MSRIKQTICNTWLIIFIAIQPALDVLAYWSQNKVATVAGYIRLLFMIAVPVILLLLKGEHKAKKKLFFELLIIAAFAILHILNSYRVGYRNFFSDVQYLMRVAQMPVLALSFIYAMRAYNGEALRNQILKGMAIAIGIYLTATVLSFITGTWNSTYGEQIGFSGWVIDSNRCANSIILVTFCTFLMYFGFNSTKPILNILLPVAVCALLLTNGTKSCYISCLGLMAAYAAFLIFGRAVLKFKIKVVPLIMAVVLFATSIAVYPITPRAQEDRLENAAGHKTVDEFLIELQDAGYDINSMTREEKLADDELVSMFRLFYVKMMYSGVPQLIDQYDIRRVLTAYDFTTDAETLIDVRRMKRTYASFIFEDSDFLTRCVGFEFDNIGWAQGALDLENDWPALFYYYGYIGFALYVLFIVWILAGVILKLFKDFQGSFTLLNYTLLLTFCLQLGLAQLSGAVIRRPNVSVFTSAIIAMIWFAVYLEEGRINSAGRENGI